MTTRRVWAPDAGQVEIEHGTTRTPMVRDAHGWWSADLPVNAGQLDYRFLLDGGEPLPDPRSPFQPEGVFGRSRFVDHTRFQWTDQGWQSPPLASAVIYEIHVGTFTPVGTFDGVVEKLQYLCDLGVSHVELMPVNEFAGSRGWGYDGVDLYAPHHAYGGPDGLKRLVNACHARGLGVILDVVYNHFGPAGCFVGRLGPYFTNRYHTPWGPAVNFDDRGSDEVRRFVIDNALMWLRDYHADGLRIDGVHAVFDQSATHILEDLAGAVRRLEAELGRHLFLIAESDLNDPRLVRPREAGGYGLDAMWSDDFHHALHTILTGERDGYYEDFGRLADLAKVYEHGFVYDGQYSVHRGRRHGRKPAGLPGSQFVVCLQNHDQVGNRALGERIAQLASPARAQIGAALVLMSPFVPLIFQGEEWAASSPFQFFTDFSSSELGQAVREGRRREFAAFGWDPARIPDPQARQTFERSRLNWDERSRAPHSAMLEWYRRLIALRREGHGLPDFRQQKVITRFDQADQWLAVRRGAAAVACNFAPQRRPLALPSAEDTADAQRWHILLSSQPPCSVSGDCVVLEPESVAILGSVCDPD
jgi:maltooligosyltrehalose trehalohydrolase